MNLAQSIARGLGAIELKDVGRPRAMPNNYGSTVARPTLTYDLIYAYYYNSWVYGAVKAIALSISDIPMVVARDESTRSRPARSISRFIREEERGPVLDWDSVSKRYKAQEKVSFIENHPVLALLDDPYPEAELTRYELIQAIVTLLETDGNGYVEKVWERGKAKTDLPARLWPKIDPRAVTVVPGEKRLVAGYIFTGGGAMKLFSWDEMMHFMYFAPLNPFYGMAAARVLRPQLITETKAIDWNRLFFEHDATPGGLLTTKERLDPSDIRMMQALWNDRYQGPGRAHQVAVLGQGAEYQQLSPSHKDMGFQDLRNFTKKEVQAAYGVPSVVLGDYEDVNRASAMTMARLYYLNTILPRLRKIEAVLSRHLLGDSSERLMFNVAVIDALQEDILVRARAGLQLAKQYVTPNELREFNGYPRLDDDGMDVVYIDPKLVPIGTVPTEENGGAGE